MEALWTRAPSVRAYDPVAMNEARRIYGERADLTLAGLGGKRRSRARTCSRS